MSVEESSIQVDNACSVSEQFTKLFYEGFDKKRHMMNRFFMDTATYTWDGNAYIGKENIQNFLESLPETMHTITAVDAQPVLKEAVKGQQTVVVQASGFIRFVKNKEVKGFSETFIITAEDSKWKIVTGGLRLQFASD